MKKKKLKLKDVKVESFVTNLTQNEKQTIEGGDVVGKLLNQAGAIGLGSWNYCSEANACTLVMGCRTNETKMGNCCDAMII